MTESHFESLLDRTPSDRDTRLLYADWLEDQGDIAAAEAIRYRCDIQKWPRGPGSRSRSGSG